MNTSQEHSVNPRRVRLDWLFRELDDLLPRDGTTEDGRRSLVRWFMSYGYALGVRELELLDRLQGRPELLAIAKGLSHEEISAGKPEPPFAEGDKVELLVTGSNAGYHSGNVQGFIWHHKKAKWCFVIEQNGEKLSKLYEGSELRAAAS